MAKHNKKRNTAFIYEVLLREVVKQSVAKNIEKRNIAITILKESFKKGSQLKKELDLYKILFETKNLPQRLADKLIEESLSQHHQINQDELFKEQSRVISIINKKISKDAFSNFVPNYKSLATISQLFSANLNPKSKIFLEAKVAQDLMGASTARPVTKNVSNLVMRTFTERFNTAHGALLEEQKETLRKFVNSFADNGVEFRFYLNEELARLKEIMEKSYKLAEIREDGTLKPKLDKVKEILEKFHEAPLNRESLIQVLQIQNLAVELTA